MGAADGLARVSTGVGEDGVAALGRAGGAACAGWGGIEFDGGACVDFGAGGACVDFGAGGAGVDFGAGGAGVDFGAG